MARMYPSEVAADNPSTAEKRFFARMRDGLSNDWAVVHSLGLAGHPGKPWAEIDFVLVGPPGVFCLEVKGGRIDRTDGRWTFTDHLGRRTTKTQGPFEQVGSASGALTRYLVARLPWMQQVTMGYGVVTPDIQFRVAGPDIEPAVLYDVRDEAKPVSLYVDRLAVYWSSRLTTQRGRAVRGLEAEEVRRVLDHLRPDFDLIPSLRMRLGIISQELLRLTQAQYQVLDGLTDNATAIVRGGAGTGKTLLALEEARRAAADGKRVLLVCFNRALAEEIQQAVDDCPLVTAASLHAFMARVIGDAGMDSQIPRAELHDVLEVFQPLVCLDALQLLGRTEAFDLLVVDEAQDILRDAYLDVLGSALRGGLEGGAWRFFYDPRQNVFEGVEPRGLKRLLQLRPALYRLTINCRNTAPIAVSAGLLSGSGCDETLVVDGPDVEVVWYSDAHDQRRLVSRHIGRLLAEGIRPQDVVILSHKRFERSDLATGFVGLPNRLESEKSGRGGGGEIAFRTISAYKGLESDVVALIDVDRIEGRDAAASLYIGASRARSHLAVFIDAKVRDDYALRAEAFGRLLARATARGPA